MKKYLLLILLIGSLPKSHAQVTRHLPVGLRQAEIPAAIRNRSVKHPYRTGLKGSEAGIPISAPALTRTASQPVYLDSIIGFTYYDLQTNRSIGNRLVVNNDGTISAVWNYAMSLGPPLNRGTGYAYFDGTMWFPHSGAIATVNTGWPNIVVTASGHEMDIAHTLDGTNSNRISVTWRAQKGTGAWTQTFPWGPSSDIWPRACSGETNDTVYAIWKGGGAGSFGVPPLVIAGQNGPIFFSRSNDGGQTWEPKRIIALIDSNYYYGFEADSYSIHARGQVVAISYSGNFNDVGLLKSLDGGDTWTKTIIQTHPIPHYGLDVLTDVDGNGTIDTISNNAGDSKVLIDHNGMCHIWFSDYRWMDDDSTDESYSYFPNVDGLYYWNESMPTDGYSLIATAQDFNGNGMLDLPTTGMCAPWGTYYGGYTIFPSAGIDDNGKIYLAYSTINESGDTVYYQQAHRNVYMMTLAPPYNPADWTYPYNIIPLYADGGAGEEQEGVFACVGPRVESNYAYVLYQRDNAPGHALSTIGTCDQMNNNNQASDIVLTRVVTATVGIRTDNSNDLFVTQNYPNPAEQVTYFNIHLRKSSPVLITVSDMIGSIIHRDSHSSMSAGLHTLQFETGAWRAGIYFYTVEAGGLKSTRKMIVR